MYNKRCISLRPNILNFKIEKEEGNCSEEESGERNRNKGEKKVVKII